MVITWIGSPNFTSGRQGNKPLEFIMHEMAGDMRSTDSVFQNRSRNTSAHAGIEDDNVHEYVRINDTAYQAGNWDVNLQSVGIEHSATPDRPPSEATYETSAQYIAKVIKENGIPKSYKPHNAIVATYCPGSLDITRIANRVNEILGGDFITPAPAPISVSTDGTATVTVDELNVRTQPNSESPLGGSQVLHRGDTFQYQGVVQGESVSGVSTWIHSTRGNYVWAGGTDYPTTPPVNTAVGGTAQAIRTANVRSGPNTLAPLAGSQTLNPGDQFGYSAKVHGQQVSQNGITSDIWYHSNRGNYVWSGNCKDI